MNLGRDSGGGVGGRNMRSSESGSMKFCICGGRGGGIKEDARFGGRVIRQWWCCLVDQVHTWEFNCGQTDFAISVRCPGFGAVRNVGMGLREG